MDMRFHRKTPSMTIPVICLAVLLLAACNGTEVGNPEKIDLSLSGDMTGFDDNEELESYLKEQYRKSVYSDYPYDLESTSVRNEDVVDGELDGGGGPDPGAPVADNSGGYTGTNLQESGVDEADVVKTDGEFLYVAGSNTTNTANRVSVVRAASPLAAISTIQVKGSVSDLYLYENPQGNKLLVVLYRPVNYAGEQWIDSGITDVAFVGIPYWIPVKIKTGMAIFDITDPLSPKERFCIEMDGYLVSSRRIENQLHVVLQFLPNLPAPYLLQDEIGDMTLPELVPYYADVTGTDVTGERIQLVAPGDFYHPDIDGGGSIVSIVTFDLDDPGLSFSSTGLVADASIVYASTQALYITSTYWNFQTTDAKEPAQQTIIYKFDLTGAQVRGRGFVTVSGRAINQFSLGEYEEVLRIATTTGRSGGSQPTAKNHVFCVGVQAGQLEVIGRLENLAPGEEIYAARFVGHRGYLVTFVTIDPLFTLDLSDPAEPKVAGELKVPGYSEYIHPYGDNHLLTIGKDALEVDGNAWYQGVQLTIFDINDFNNPRLLHQTEGQNKIGDRGTTSEALYNHKAFTFWEERGLLAIPVDLYEHESPPEYPWEWGSLTFKGLYVYRVDLEDGFELIGRIETLADLGPYWYSYGEYTRGVFINERVYAVTSAAVRSAEVEDMAHTLETLAID
jgi:inhibitor of cysteine peptidase